MDDQNRTKTELLAEVAVLRQQVAALQKSEEQCHALIDDQKRAEQELARSKALLEATIESLPFDFWTMCPEGRYTMQNAVSKAHWGNRLGQTPEDVTSDANILSLWLDNNRRAFAGERVEEEASITVNDERRVLNNVIVPIREGEHISGILGVNIDITQRKRAEEALRRAHDELERRVEERTAELTEANETLRREIEHRQQAQEALRQSEVKYRGMVDACPDAVVMSDPDGTVLFASPQTWPLLGLSAADELLGKSVFDYVIEDDRRRLAANMSQVTEAGLRRNTEYTALRRDGKTVPAEASSVVIRDSEGRPKALMAVIRDITGRKEAEEALQREHRTLKHLLQSSDHERQTIAYEIHDGLAQYIAAAIMQFEVYRNLRETRPKDAAQAYDAGLTMLRQSHFEARRLISGVRPPILDEEGIVAAVSHLVNEERGKRGPKIEYLSKVEFQRFAPILENAIYRIAQEALTNACRHSKSEKVEIELVQAGDQLRIEVRDRVAGFKLADVEEGQFGLAGIRERARLLGGQATIESEPGKGTRIAVELPIVLGEDEDRAE